MAHAVFADTPPLRLRPEQVPALARLAREAAGIELHGGKIEFLQARLARRLTACGLREFDDYARLVESDPGERRAFVEALTTHTTSFFREADQYRWLEAEGLPEIFANAVGREVVIWSAACSSGQEGWSALMVAERLRRTRLYAPMARLIGTDISTQVLRRAATAVYSGDEVASLPLEHRRLFLLSARSGDGRCRITPELRARASWRQANLVEGSGLEGVSADVVFLRNVLIYFDAETQRRVIDTVVRRLRPGGYLLTGHTETAYRRPDLAILRPSIYRKDA